jgi:hypothetical protein
LSLARSALSAENAETEVNVSTESASVANVFFIKSPLGYLLATVNDCCLLETVIIQHQFLQKIYVFFLAYFSQHGRHPKCLH